MELFDAISPILKVQSIINFSPIKYDNQSKTFEPSIYRKTIFLIFRFFSAFVEGIYIQNFFGAKLYFTDGLSLTNDIATFLNNLLLTTDYFIISFFMFYYSVSHIEILNELLALDRNLKQFIKINYGVINTYNKIGLSLVVLMLISIFTISNILHFIFIRESILHYVLDTFFLIDLAILSLSAIYLSSILWIIYVQANHLNSYATIHQKHLADMIMHHDRLCKIINKVGKSFYFIFAGVSLAALSTGLGHFYRFFWCMIQLKIDIMQMLLRFYAVDLLWFMTNFIALLQIAYVSVLVENEVNDSKTYILVNP